MIALTAAQIALATTSFTPYETTAGVPLRWPSEAIVTIHLGPSPAPELTLSLVEGMLHTALAAWLETPCPFTNVVDLRPDAEVIATAGALDETDGVVSVVWFDDVTAWNQRFGSTELARTILIHRSISGEIVDADIAVNLGGYLFAANADCPADRYDLASTLTHELGHVLGLDHSLVASATMAKKAEVGECDKRTLDPDDVAGICTSYTTPARPEPDPTPEASPEPTAELAPEVERVDGRDDDGCAGGHAGLVPLAALLAPLALLSVRRARRASGGCRRSRRPSPARS